MTEASLRIVVADDERPARRFLVGLIKMCPGTLLVGEAATGVIYVPGDNEWTDCHRLNNGGYDPLERLAFLKSTFFPSDESLGIRKGRSSARARTRRTSRTART